MQQKIQKKSHVLLLNSLLSTLSGQGLPLSPPKIPKNLQKIAKIHNFLKNRYSKAPPKNRRNFAF